MYGGGTYKNVRAKAFYINIHVFVDYTLRNLCVTELYYFIQYKKHFSYNKIDYLSVLLRE